MAWAVAGQASPPVCLNPDLEEPPLEVRGKFRLPNQSAPGFVCQDRPWLHGPAVQKILCCMCDEIVKPFKTGLLKSNSLYNLVVTTKVHYFLTEHYIISLLLLLHLSGIVWEYDAV